MHDVISIESRCRCSECKHIFKKTALIGREQICAECDKKRAMEWVRAIDAARNFSPTPPKAG